VNIAPIVEGHGDAEAVPVLLRRLVGDRATILRPFRLPRGRLAKEVELTRAILHTVNSVQPVHGILVVLDADDDCPAELGTRLSACAQARCRGSRVAVVAAVREFEAWFLAAATSLQAVGKLPSGIDPVRDPEGVRDAKGWLSAALGRRYSEVLDQPAFAALFDVDEAMRAPSFAKLRRDLARILSA
jgi:hypothetical protein